MNKAIVARLFKGEHITMQEESEYAKIDCA